MLYGRYRNVETSMVKTDQSHHFFVGECAASCMTGICPHRLEPSKSPRLRSQRERKNLEYIFSRSVSEVDLMSAVYPLSFHRRVERQWAGRINSLRQIHGQIVIGTERTLQRVFNNDCSLILVSIRAVADRRQLDQSRPHD